MVALILATNAVGLYATTTAAAAAALCCGNYLALIKCNVYFYKKNKKNKGIQKYY